MVYEYNSRIHLAEVALNVKDLESQTAFYHQLLGLEILIRSEKEILLGAGGKPLVRLIKTDDISHPKQSYGLYHMALLLPTREDLANVFKHLLDLKIPLVGGADHGYSEAIYLEDLEGNGIELYRDKPVTVWDIREDGRIIGVTEELSAQDIYELGKKSSLLQSQVVLEWGMFIYLLRIVVNLVHSTKSLLILRINSRFHTPVGSHQGLITII